MKKTIFKSLLISSVLGMGAISSLNAADIQTNVVTTTQVEGYVIEIKNVNENRLDVIIENKRKAKNGTKNMLLNLRFKKALAVEAKDTIKVGDIIAAEGNLIAPRSTKNKDRRDQHILKVKDFELIYDGNYSEEPEEVEEDV